MTVASMCDMFRTSSKKEIYINLIEENLTIEQREVVKNIVQNYNIMNYMVDRDENDSYLSFVKFLGTNGKENSIKSSLMDIYNLLNEVEKIRGVKRVQVDDVSIDNLDDLYTYAITVIF